MVDIVSAFEQVITWQKEGKEKVKFRKNFVSDKRTAMVEKKISVYDKVYGSPKGSC
jgi:hypothetical protein